MKTTGISLSLVVVLIASFSLLGGNNMGVLKAFDGTEFIDVSGVTDHGKLDGLVDAEDHLYALLKDGTRNLEGDWLVDSDKQIRFRDTSQGIGSSGSSTLDMDAASQINFNIGGVTEAFVKQSLLNFTQDGSNVALDWTIDDQLKVKIGPTLIHKFTIDSLEPVTDTGANLGRTTARYGNVYSDAVSPSTATDPSDDIAGDMWFNETKKTHRLLAADATHNIVGAEALTTANDTVTNTVTETLFADTKDIAANSLVVGAAYEWAAWGKLSTSGTVDFTFRLKLDAVVVVDSGTLGQSGAGGWFLKGYFTVRSIGASGTVQGNAEVGYPNGGSGPVFTSVPVTVDTTQILTAAVSVEMGTANPFNNAVLQQFILKKVS